MVVSVSPTIVLIPRVLTQTPVTLRSICISTTSPSIISLSSFIRTPIDFLNACVKASVLDISSENISDDASIVKGVSGPSD